MKVFRKIYVNLANGIENSLIFSLFLSFDVRTFALFY